jgi:hypothetical protein
MRPCIRSAPIFADFGPYLVSQNAEIGVESAIRCMPERRKGCEYCQGPRAIRRLFVNAIYPLPSTLKLATSHT